VIGAPGVGAGGEGEAYVVFGFTSNVAPVARDDALILPGGAVVDLAADNGSGADVDESADDPLQITHIDGNAIAQGETLSLGDLRVTLTGATEVRIDHAASAIGAQTAFAFDYVLTDKDGAQGGATVTGTLTHAGLKTEALTGGPGGGAGASIDGSDGERLGHRVVDAGDVNGDGFDDVLIGAPNASPDGGELDGAVYLLFGSPDGIPDDLDLEALAPSQGIKIVGESSFRFLGVALDGGEDVNGDGFDDFVVTQSGLFDRVVLGRADIEDGVDLASLDGTDGFTLVGASGTDVALLSDMNGDGLADIAVTDRFAGEDANAHAVRVVFGTTSTTATRDVTTADGFLFQGLAVQDRQLGRSLADAGDLNGDGLSDLFVGSDNGLAHVVFGSTTAFPADFTRAAPAGAEVATMSGGAGFGAVAQSNSGDVNGDGFDDLLIYEDGIRQAGLVHVVFGGIAPATGALAGALNGANGFTINGGGDFSKLGHALSFVGDVDGDGFDDIALVDEGDLSAETPVGPRAHVLLGGTGLGASVDITSLAPQQGFSTAPAPSPSGFSAVDGGGDVNGDGIADLILGMDDADTDGGAGSGRALAILGDAANRRPEARDDTVTVS